MTTPNHAPVSQLEADLVDRLRALCQQSGPIAFASSLGAEDMVLTDIIARNQLPIDIFTLDTGRLPEQTYNLLADIAKHYPKLGVRIVFPQANQVEQHVARFGINGFYDSVEARKACCAARKIEPLQRALSSCAAWITGLRKEQSEARAELTYSAFDSLTQKQKFNPLLEWTAHDVAHYLRAHQVPVNALHALGYPSIGCAPCTRAVQPGEHPRAGRWWWEAAEQGQAAQECGLHVDSSGRLVRANA